MLPRPTNSKDRPPSCLHVRIIRGWSAIAALLACVVALASASAEPVTITEDRMFHPVDYNTFDVMPGAPEDGVPLAGQPYQDFTPQVPSRTFPNCRLPLLSWRIGPGPECGQYGPNFTPLLPAH